MIPGDFQPDDLHVRFRDGEWVIETEASEVLARYPTQAAAWGYAQTKSHSSRVAAFRHKKDGSINATVSHRHLIKVPWKALMWAGIASVGTLIVIATISSLMDGNGGSKATDEGETESVAQGLAVLDAGGFVAPDDPEVLAYKRRLDQLRDDVCPIPEERVADMAVSAQAQARRGGWRPERWTGSDRAPT